MTRFLNWLEGVLGKYPFSVIFTNLFAIAFGACIAWLCILLSSDAQQQVLNFLIALMGALVGWALGMFFAPYNDKEAARFSSIGQAVSAFISGYAVSKVDRLFEETLFDDSASPVPISWIRMGLFFCSTLLVMLSVFSNRAYFRT